ncbi:MAG: fumarylacetoacetate hydrolase family protein [Bacteroidales bacterium]|nr:fumarylacetoacetate hydrolase family protein [Bacteroidales bacterium]
MKIFLIEKPHPHATAPFIFSMKPDTALLQRNRPFFIPEWTQVVRYEVALVLKICKNGKYIQERFAHTYYDAIGVGIDFMAHDIQNDLIACGLPWEKAKVFDRSAPVGTFLPKEQLNVPQGIRFALKKNGEHILSGSSLDMRYTFDQIIAELSQYVTLKMGDLIFTDPPADGGTVAIGDRLEAFIEDKMLLRVPIK